MSKGFTLVELIIIIAIIGILTAISVITYSDYVKRSIITTALDEISSLRNDYELIYNENYSGISELNHLSTINSDYCKIVVIAPDSSTRIAEKAITCSFKNDELFGRNAEIYLSRNVAGFYECHVRNIVGKYIPKSCL